LELAVKTPRCKSNLGVFFEKIKTGNLDFTDDPAKNLVIGITGVAIRAVFF